MATLNASRGESCYALSETANLQIPRKIELYELEDQDLLQMYLRQFDDSLRVAALVECEDVIYGMVYIGSLRGARNWDMINRIRADHKGKQLRKI